VVKKKDIRISLVYFFVHLVVNFLITPFLVSFGSGSLIKKIILLFSNFPVAYSNNFSGKIFLLSQVVNSLFWSLILFLALVLWREIRKRA